MDIVIRAYEEKDLPEMIGIWNEVVEEGIAFPQEEPLDKRAGRSFFASQTYCGVAEETGNGSIFGLGIYAMQVMRSAQNEGGCILAKDWCWTALSRGKSTGSGYCSSMLSFLLIFMQGIFMSGLVLSSWERFRKDFGKRTDSMKTYVRTIMNCSRGSIIYSTIFHFWYCIFFNFSHILSA